MYSLPYWLERLVGWLIDNLIDWMIDAYFPRACVSYPMDLSFSGSVVSEVFMHTGMVGESV